MCGRERRENRRNTRRAAPPSCQCPAARGATCCLTGACANRLRHQAQGRLGKARGNESTPTNMTWNCFRGLPPAGVRVTVACSAVGSAGRAGAARGARHLGNPCLPAHERAQRLAKYRNLLSGPRSGRASVLRLACKHMAAHRLSALVARALARPDAAPTLPCLPTCLPAALQGVQHQWGRA